MPTTADFKEKGSSVSTARATRLVLTDRHLRRLKLTAHAQDFYDVQQRGLIARILPSGIVKFSVRYRFQGKQKRLKLGAYPAVSLQSARKRARNAHASIDEGHDPAGQRHAAKAPRTDTIESLAADYLKKHARKHKRSAHEDERILDVDVLPHWREVSVRDLTRRDVRALIDRVADRAPIMANRVLALVRKMLNFAVDQDWIDANPAARVQKPAREVSRDRVLTNEELRRLWRVLSNLPSTTDKPAPGRARAKGSKDDPICPISAPLAALLKVRLLTVQRGGEVTRMRWIDLDLESGWWTIPATDTKNGESHRVPLSDDVVALIRAQQKNDGDREYVFLGQSASLRDRAKKAPSAIARVTRDRVPRPRPSAHGGDADRGSRHPTRSHCQSAQSRRGWSPRDARLRSPHLRSREAPRARYVDADAQEHHREHRSWQGSAVQRDRCVDR